jgi:hypothetical protein
MLHFVSHLVVSGTNVGKSDCVCLDSETAQSFRWILLFWLRMLLDDKGSCSETVLFTYKIALCYKTRDRNMKNHRSEYLTKKVVSFSEPIYYHLLPYQQSLKFW